MKKRLLALLMAIAVSSSLLIACGDTPAPESSDPEVEISEEISAEVSDGGSEDSTVVYDAAYGYFANFPSDNNTVKAEALFTMMDAGDDMLIIDIRQPEDYAKGHLKGAVNLSFFDMSIPENIASIPDDKPVMVYCYTGQTSSQAAVALNICGKMAKTVQSGYNNGISAQEGFEAHQDTEAAVLDGTVYPVADELNEAITNYFLDLRAVDGTGLANFNISAEDTKAVVDAADGSYQLVSVRQAKDFAEGNIKGFINIPFAQGMEVALAELSKDTPIIVNCYSGQTASQVVAVLRMMGYEAYNLSGGMGKADGGGWLGAGYEVETA